MSFNKLKVNMKHNKKKFKCNIIYYQNSAKKNNK